MQLEREPLTTFCETTEMTGHASFLEADGLSTFWTGLSKEAVFIFEVPFALTILKVSLLQNSANSIGYGQNQSILLKDRVLSSNPFQLTHDVFHRDTRAEGERNETTYGLCLRGG